MLGIQALPVAVGVYLPLSTSAGMFAGGIVRWLVERRAQSEHRSLAEIESGPGVATANLTALVLFGLLGALLYRVGLRKS